MRTVVLRKQKDPLVKRIIILSQARSGSTLLQRILHCCIPDANIHGENHDFWGHICESFYAWEKTTQRPEAVGVYTREDNFKPCWWNSYAMNDLTKTYRRLFDDMYQARMHRVVGFKEVRVPHTLDKLSQYIAFFRKLFPSCYFVFTYRQIDQLVQSGWWKESDREHLTHMERILSQYAATNPDHSFLISFDEIQNAHHAERLFGFLNELFPVAKYEQVKGKVM